MNSDGSYSYLADGAASKAIPPGHTATDSFTYTMRDTDGLTSTTTLTITISGLNEAPVAVADIGSALEAGGVNNGIPGSSATGNVLDNDTDLDTGDTKTVTTVAGTGAGLVAVQHLAHTARYSSTLMAPIPTRSTTTMRRFRLRAAAGIP